MNARMHIVGMILGPALAGALWAGVSTAGPAPGAQASNSVITGKVYAFEKIADGVYYATSNGGPMNTGGNHPFS